MEAYICEVITFRVIYHYPPGECKVNDNRLTTILCKNDMPISSLHQYFLFYEDLKNNILSGEKFSNKPT